MPTNIWKRVGQSKNMLSSTFEPASIKYEVLGWHDHGSIIMIHVDLKSHWIIFNTLYRQWKWKISHIPHKASARFLFSTNSYTRRRCVWCKQHPFNFTRFLCLTPVIDTTSFKKSSMPWWDFVVNSFTANFVPSNRIPYKIHKKMMCCLLEIWHHSNQSKNLN